MDVAANVISVLDPVKGFPPRLCSVFVLCVFAVFKVVVVAAIIFPAHFLVIGNTSTFIDYTLSLDFRILCNQKNKRVETKANKDIKYGDLASRELGRRPRSNPQ
jgi:hypothetical protein